MANDTFVNPYTFIGLGDKAIKHKKEKNVRSDDRLTGVLHCTLEPLTPLFIPNTANDNAFPKLKCRNIDAWNNANQGNKLIECEEKEVRSYDFYSYDNPEGDRAKIKEDQLPPPIIPGSSLRGAMRSAYETLTNSCMSTIDEETELHRRSALPYNRQRSNTLTGVGIVENGILRKGKKALIQTDAPWHNPMPLDRFPCFERETLPKWGRIKVSFNGTYGFGNNCVVSSVNKPGDTTDAYFLPGEQFGTGTKKRFDTIIYDIEDSSSGKMLDKDYIRRIEKLSERYKGYNGWKDAIPMPVYFEKVGSIYYISPACISQEVFARSLKTILGEFSPCKNSEALCDACKLFGMVGKKVETDAENKNTDNEKTNAVASRVMFRDAVSLGKGSWYEKPRTLAILGQPHITATEFYMEEIARADFYNYDYKVTHTPGRNRDGNPKWNLQQKTALGDDEVRIRGRKYYWHQKEQKYANLEKDKPNMTMTVRAVKASTAENPIKFKFDIAFEDVTKDELSKLIWVLTIGGKNTHAHKMGHGKPIGFGSVLISVDSTEIFEIDYNLNICSSVSKPVPSLPTPILNNIEEIESVTVWENGLKNIQYPQGTIDGDENIYNWFVLNREMPDAKPNAQAFKNVLPKVGEEQALPFYSKRGKSYRPNPAKGNRIRIEQEEIDANAHANRNKINPQQLEKDPLVVYRPSSEDRPRIPLQDVRIKAVTPTKSFSPRDKQINDALKHFKNEYGRFKANDAKHLEILRSVSDSDSRFVKIQNMLKKFGG